MTCQELVELVTDYLEDALPDDDRVRFEAHLAECDACRAHVEQLEQTIALSRHVEAELLPPGLREELLSAFRAWRAEQSL